MSGVNVCTYEKEKDGVGGKGRGEKRTEAWEEAGLSWHSSVDLPMSIGFRSLCQFYLESSVRREGWEQELGACLLLDMLMI